MGCFIAAYQMLTKAEYQMDGQIPEVTNNVLQEQSLEETFHFSNRPKKIVLLYFTRWARVNLVNMVKDVYQSCPCLTDPKSYAANNEASVNL